MKASRWKVASRSGNEMTGGGSSRVVAIVHGQTLLGVAVYEATYQAAAQLKLDRLEQELRIGRAEVGVGGSGFSVEAPEGVRFLIRSQVFDDAEYRALQQAGPAPRGPQH